MPSSFSVVAIIAAFNEADIIEHVIRDLVSQGIGVYFMDDHSTDETLAIAERWLGRGVVGIERLCETFKEDPPDGFAWERILLRKAQLAQEIDANWFIHHDADEFRESPWEGVPLSEAIQRVDAHGFNAIDSFRLDFWPVHDRFRPGDDVREAFTFWATPAPYDRLQVRCWRKTTSLVDLASSGGHEVVFPERKIFPMRFILRHYAIRGQAHGERKVRERRARFLPHERERGWHVQYDQVPDGVSFIRDPSSLTPYDADSLRMDLILRHRGVEDLEKLVAALRADLDGLRAEVRRYSEDLDAARAEIKHKSDALVQSESERVDLRREVERTGAEIARLTTDTARATAEIADLKREAVDLRNALADVSGRLDAFYRSWSWRWTSPARAVYRLLRGL
jgi:hypothetical protein